MTQDGCPSFLSLKPRHDGSPSRVEEGRKSDSVDTRWASIHSRPMRYVRDLISIAASYTPTCIYNRPPCSGPPSTPPNPSFFPSNLPSLASPDTSPDPWPITNPSGS
ncbi:hypothetical protein BO71DRAFT_216198 [Aspergillus ellipticus CBS 707.79]|uniref:Uncharacterized protein n=1 Tax=Aspergillus ellipticus CBS 707.79 TaxID=1448320 RepID=A0A319DCR6_9EURO|nr:hypothetical protein BO71DRAFT_216198 [Aspergillus ellipticus CBS 707.79]